MAVLRTNPTGKCSLSRTRGRAYLYTHYRSQTAKVLTRTSVKAPRKIMAANTGLAHLPTRIKCLPYLKMETLFTYAEVIHDAVVEVDAHRFLISGYYDPTKPVNGALKKAVPCFEWHGEICVVALGVIVPYLRTVKPGLALRAMKKFMATFLMNRHEGSSIAETRESVDDRLGPLSVLSLRLLSGLRLRSGNDLLHAVHFHCRLTLGPPHRAPDVVLSP
ncbi:hypothetical protein B0H13DRAFT_2337318 [Mycena leptocephala]|nr:hypothetical protein B0H13DRAFT_2337318 [Mycena leptocephala]